MPASWTPWVVEFCELKVSRVTARLPPWSMSTALPEPMIDVLSMVSVPPLVVTLPPPSSMPIAPLAVPVRLRPLIVLSVERVTPTPLYWIDVLLVDAPIVMPLGIGSKLSP